MNSWSKFWGPKDGHWRQVFNYIFVCKNVQLEVKVDKKSKLIFFRQIIKYLRDKPFGKQFVTDDLSINLAMAVFSTNFFLSLAIVTREIFGPFHDWIVKPILFCQIFFQFCMLFSLLAMQVAQFSNVFYSDRWVCKFFFKSSQFKNKLNFKKIIKISKFKTV